MNPEDGGQPVCPLCRVRICEWRNDRHKYRPSCKLCRVPTSNAERSIRNKGLKASSDDFQAYVTKILSKKICERCGFIPEHSCQLDIDHIDGNSSNNCPENWQALCANCHRLKTVLNKDYESGCNRRLPQIGSLKLMN